MREPTLSEANPKEELSIPPASSPAVWHDYIGADIRYAWLNKFKKNQTGDAERVSETTERKYHDSGCAKNNRIFIYNECIQLFVATSVYSIRIDSRIRKMIDELPGCGCQEEIRNLIENTVRKKRREQLLARAQTRHDTMSAGMPAVGIIREARDVR